MPTSLLARGGRLCAAAMACALLAPLASPLSSQTAVLHDRGATRDELTAAAGVAERLATSAAYSERTRARARGAAQAIRLRLTDGDFRVGDQVRVDITGPVPVNDTLAVRDSLILEIPGIRRVRLHGVLRSEIETTLLREVREVVRDANVTARPLVRVAVFGLVTQPGYFSVVPETRIDELITLAGGPAGEAATDRLQLMRGDTLLLDGTRVQLAISRGETLDALGVQEGDALRVPQRAAPWDRASTLQIVTMLVTPLLTLFAVQ